MADDGDAQYKSLRANTANCGGVMVHSLAEGKEPLPLYKIVANNLSRTFGDEPYSRHVRYVDDEWQQQPLHLQPHRGHHRPTGERRLPRPVSPYEIRMSSVQYHGMRFTAALVESGGASISDVACITLRFRKGLCTVVIAVSSIPDPTLSLKMASTPNAAFWR
jgi:hypothetical protein